MCLNDNSFNVSFREGRPSGVAPLFYISVEGWVVLPSFFVPLHQTKHYPYEQKTAFLSDTLDNGAHFDRLGAG